ncbi:hypothetical protein PIB30_015446 [Stylosanthes scabra]|uniref:Uncharacterized protein n=1 Tax=Stylosanthes scabra TaxID=79078 RepID=A0ABU6U824_9FABA|nr:hypothetical protein [Stylosanthes scabra]
MAVEKNQRHLLLQADTRICGIDVTKLIKPEEEEEEAVDWEKQPPPPFDSNINLGVHARFGLRIQDCSHWRHLSGAKPSNKFYEVDLDKEEVVESKSIKDSELTFNSMHHHLHKIGDDYYYFIMMDDVKPMACDHNFRV